MGASRVAPVVVVAAAAVLTSCSKRAGVAPVPVEAVGAPDYFGRGIIRVSEGGDRVLIQLVVAAYTAIIRFDSAGDVSAAAVAERRRDPGMTWLTVPVGRDVSQGGSASVANPICSENSPRARRECSVQPRVITLGTVPLRHGESVILIVSEEPLRPAMIEDRLNMVPMGAGLARVPAFVMTDRRDLWAAYLIRK